MLESKLITCQTQHHLKTSHKDPTQIHITLLFQQTLRFALDVISQQTEWKDLWVWLHSEEAGGKSQVRERGADIIIVVM